MDLTRHAKELELDMDRFWDELRRREHAPRVDRDVASADASGVVGTPSFFINGRRHSGAYDVASLTHEVEAARERADRRRKIRGVSDESIAARIERLVSEEHELRDREQADSPNPAALEEDKERLRTVEVELDRCWDLLRQRRALRDAGSDPGQAAARDAETVEHYQQ